MASSDDQGPDWGTCGGAYGAAVVVVVVEESTGVVLPRSGHVPGVGGGA